MLLKVLIILLLLEDFEIICRSHDMLIEYIITSERANSLPLFAINYFWFLALKTASYSLGLLTYFQSTKTRNSIYMYSHARPTNWIHTYR